MGMRSMLKKKNLLRLMKQSMKTDRMFWFTEELALRGVIRLRDHHEFWGKYYNISECCIEHYIRLIEQGIENPARYMCETYEDYPHVGYVPCPKCFNKV